MPNPFTPDQNGQHFADSFLAQLLAPQTPPAVFAKASNTGTVLTIEKFDDMQRAVKLNLRYAWEDEIMEGLAKSLNS